MQISEITEKSEWEKILKNFSSVCFLQSWNWGVFQESLGSKVKRVVITEGDKTAAAQFYIKKSRLFTFLYLPRGPLSNSEKLADQLIDSLRANALTFSVDFILIEPDDMIYHKLANRFIVQPSMQPQHSSLLNLTPNLEILKSNLRKTTRQMIKKAAEVGVKVEVADISKWEEFVKLLKETTQRQGFNPHSLSYMRKQLEIFSTDGQAKLYLAYQGKKALAGAVIVSYGGTSVYLHAASTHEGRKIGAAQALVWQVIQDAKESGSKIFDLWGVAPDDSPTHPWAGISIFKNGFGGEMVNYPGGFVLPVVIAKYKLYRLMNFLRSRPLFKTAQRALLRAIIRG